LRALNLLARLEGAGPAPRQTVAGDVVFGLGTVLSDLRSTHLIAVKRVADAAAMIRRNAGRWDGRRIYVGAQNLADMSR